MMTQLARGTSAPSNKGRGGTKVLSVLSTLVLLALAPSAGSAQVLTLGEALERAEVNAYANRMADADAEATGARETEALGGILPSLRFEAGYLRTTDPVGAFGTALRQRRIAEPDFDPARLNYPAAAGNYTGALVLEQPVLNLDAHLGRRAASRAGDAADASASWTRLGTRLDVIRAYYGAVLAQEKVRTLRAAEQAARQHVEQAEAAVRAGTVTVSDALLARVRAGEVEADLLEAEGDAEVALHQLATVLGTPADIPLAPESLPSTKAVRRLLASEAPEPLDRADVEAARLATSASGVDLQRARSLALPRLNGFARWDWNSPSSLYGGEGNWTVGLMATWTPFTSASTWSERQAAASRAEGARVALEAARAKATLEVERAVTARSTALARLDIAERAATQSAEAHRIVTKKYEGGLATVAELLDAAAVEIRSGLSLSQARWAGIVAEAELRRALGHDPADIADSLQKTVVAGSPAGHLAGGLR